MGHESGWLIEGFHYTMALWGWLALALVYGVWRSLLSPEPDPIRPSGPTGD